MLEKFASFPHEARAKWRVARVHEIDLPRISVRDQGWSLVNRAVTIDTGDRGGVARLAVKHAVAMNVDVKMAIAALHPVRQMHVFQVNRFGKPPRIVVFDLVVVQIEQIAFAIVFEDRAEDPAVSVIIGKLRVLKLRI